jgi:hypothetical protein
MNITQKRMLRHKYLLQKAKLMSKCMYHFMENKRMENKKNMKNIITVELGLHETGVGWQRIVEHNSPISVLLRSQ